MERLEPMDIDRFPTPEEQKFGEIISWATEDSYEDKDGYVHMVFKKDTPKKIIKEFQDNLDIMWFKTKGDYSIEK